MDRLGNATPKGKRYFEDLLDVDADLSALATKLLNVNAAGTKVIGASGLTWASDRLTVSGAQTIDGAANVIQQILQAHSTQTANLVENQLSDGTVVSKVDSKGRVISYGTNGTVSNLVFGDDAFEDWTSGTSNVVIGSGAAENATTMTGSIAVGYLALRAGAGYSVAIGAGALRQATSAAGNSVAIGQYAGYGVTDAISGIYIGMYAGYRSNVSNLLLVDNQLRADAATEATNAILYGVMATTPAAQSLRINAVTEVSQTLQAAGYKSSDGSAGWTGTFTNGDAATVTVKNGLITGVV